MDESEIFNLGQSKVGPSEESSSSYRDIWELDLDWQRRSL